MMLASNEIKQSEGGTIEHSREKILRAAMEHFAEKGLENASVRAISKVAGVNHALIGYNFGSKLALYEAVIERCTDVLIRPRLEALEKLESAARGKPIPLKKLVDAYVRGCQGPGINGYATRFFHASGP